MYVHLKFGENWTANMGDMAKSLFFQFFFLSSLSFLFFSFQLRWSRNLSASWAERFRTSSLLCTYKLCDYYSPIPILSPFLFTPPLYVAILNLQDFSFTCSNGGLAPKIWLSTWTPMNKHSPIMCKCISPL